jgi:hypothetical protein
MVETPVIVKKHHTKHNTYWLRDDKASGVCDYERYSMYKGAPYGKLYTFSMDLRDAAFHFYRAVHKDLNN